MKHTERPYYILNLSLFLHKIFFKLGPVRNSTLNPNFSISFFIFGLIFGIQGKVIVCFLLVLLLLLLLLRPRVFFSKLLIIFCNVFLSCPFSQISQSGILFQYFNIEIYFRTDFGSSHKKFFEYASNCVRGYTIMWLNLYIG